MKSLYCLVECKYYLGSNEHTSYGVAICEKKDDHIVILETVADISADKDKIISFIDTCNRLILSEIHFEEAISDIIVV